MEIKCSGKVIASALLCKGKSGSDPTTLRLFKFKISRGWTWRRLGARGPQLCSQGSPLQLGMLVSWAPGSPSIGIQRAERRAVDHSRSSRGPKTWWLLIDLPQYFFIPRGLLQGQWASQLPLNFVWIEWQQAQLFIHLYDYEQFDQVEEDDSFVVFLISSFHLLALKSFSTELTV